MQDSDSDEDGGEKAFDDEPEVSTSKTTKGRSDRKKIDEMTLSNKVYRRALDLTRQIYLC